MGKNTHRQRLARRLASVTGDTYQQALSRVTEAAEAGLLPSVLNEDGMAEALHTLTRPAVTQVGKAQDQATVFASSSTIRFGVSDDGTEVHFDLATDLHLLVSGPSGSGKTMALLTLASGVVDQGWDLFVVDAAASGENFEQVAPYARAVAADVWTGAAVVVEVSAEMDRRRVQMADAGVGHFTELPEAVTPVVLVIDDVLTLLLSEPIGTAASDGGVQNREARNAVRRDITFRLERLIRDGRNAGIVMILSSQNSSKGPLTGLLGVRSLMSETSRLDMGGPQTTRGDGSYETNRSPAMTVHVDLPDAGGRVERQQVADGDRLDLSRAVAPAFVDAPTTADRRDFGLGLRRLLHLMQATDLDVTDAVPLAVDGLGPAAGTKLEAVAEHVTTGHTLAQELANHPRWFPKWIVAVVADYATAGGALSKLAAAWDTEYPSI